ncbi:MarR family transcriptional regulator [uncultured Tateyamaria sp.]|uniref:MarR family winged helix-turn-helix transcriptional regulator n=1 Tax=uncultured Tateyamaria sp. TaxID=455651 RepID=UPI002628B274|nr:MarR family transcriptional regulator [uncultured Tateyamaria sp.]
MVKEAEIAELAGGIALVIRALLVAGRKGQPAEGKMPFNPLYFNMLRTLDEGPTRPTHMGQKLGVSKTTLSAAVKALEKRGLLQRAPDPDDGRAQVLSVTDEGRDVITAIKRQDKRNAAAMLAVLEPGETAAFASAFRRIGEALDTQ